jgi:CubicO group peptidase (beta-lactamase class C family)
MLYISFVMLNPILGCTNSSYKSSDEEMIRSSVTDVTNESDDTSVQEFSDTGVYEDPDFCPEDGVWPDPVWQVDSPENHGMSSYYLEQAAQYAKENQSDCMVVVKDGNIVGEWYWNNTSPFDKVKSWSVGKSYAATAIGLAYDRGLIESTEQSVADFIPEWQGTEMENISIHHMLSMTSGLRFNLIEDNLLMAFSNNMTARALNNPLENPPGAYWEYNNHTVQLSEPIIKKATGINAEEFMKQNLWDPVGIDAVWEKDNQGQPAMFMNVRASCRDHARFAYLYLNKGCWNGQRILSEDWINKSLTPSSSQNQGYGYWWWLNGGTPTLDSVTFEEHEHGMLHEFAPEDAFCAVGLGSQMVEVIPSEDLIVVRFGPAPHENLSLWIEQNGAVMDALTNDGKQIVHNGILERVLHSIIE